MPMPIYRDWLQDEGIDPPELVTAELGVWKSWWESKWPKFDDRRLHHAWHGLNHLRFHDLIERRPSETAYCVMQILWDYDDAWYHAGHEGGEPLRAYRTRERAEQERQRLEQGDPIGQRGYRTEHGYFPRDPEQFLDHQCDQESYWKSLVRENAPQFEVVEIDLLGGG